MTIIQLVYFNKYILIGIYSVDSYNIIFVYNLTYITTYMVKTLRKNILRYKYIYKTNSSLIQNRKFKITTIERILNLNTYNL